MDFYELYIVPSNNRDLDLPDHMINTYGSVPCDDGTNYRVYAYPTTKPSKWTGYSHLSSILDRLAKLDMILSCKCEVPVTECFDKDKILSDPHYRIKKICIRYTEDNNRSCGWYLEEELTQEVRDKLRNPETLG